jgi:asparagine synthase (glutamine-hydrolysing)
MAPATSCDVSERRNSTTTLPAIFNAMDQPSIDGVNTWFVAKAAKEAGLKVALSGLGGDELLAGYPSFRDLPRWRRRFGPLATVPGLGWLARRLALTFAPRFAHANPKALGIFDYASSWAGAYLLRRGLFLPHELTQLMDSGLACEGLRRLRPLRGLSASLVPDPGSDVARVAILESAQYMRNQLLRDADWAGMAHGVEIRLPLVDTTLLETLSAVIGQIMAGAGKLALAAAPSHPLKDEIVTRAKTGFGVPTSAWAEDASASSGLGKSGKSKGLTSRRWSRFVIKAVGPASDKWLPVLRA